MGLVGVKVLSGFLFFFIAFIFGCLPFFVFRRCLSTNSKSQNPGRSTLVHCLHALASGVLIATCLLHLLPESLENVQDTLERRQLLTVQDHKNASQSDTAKVSQDSKNDWILYPVAELLVAFGFLAIYMIDTTMKSMQSYSRGDREVKYSRLNNYDDYEDEDVEIYAQKVKHSVSNGDSRDRKLPLRQNSVPLKSTTDDSVSNQKESSHVRSIALVLALCIHGFFDGVMLGLQTSTSVLYSLMVALSLHKTFVATSLSITLLKNHSSTSSPLRVVVYVFLFASVAPLGLVASAAFIQSSLFASQGEGEGEVGLAPGCIQAFAVGTFLYVTFTEATGRHEEKRSLKLELLCHVFLLVGFTFMAIMRLTFSE